MSRIAYDIFALIINFLDENWQPKKVTINLFEATKMIDQTLTRNLSELLDFYGLKKKIIVSVKDERANVNSMTIFFKSVINCDILGLEESFNGQKCIMWPKKFRKGKQKWMKACVH
jgi:hypothetical protein